jgi:hypothetical protein
MPQLRLVRVSIRWITGGLTGETVWWKGINGGAA